MPTLNLSGGGSGDKPGPKDNDGEDVTRLTAGVQRKINIGNFESIDVYCSASLSIDDINNLDDAKRQELLDGMEVLISVCAEKTREKYDLIKSQN